MKARVEPPVLLSRILMFVFAATTVALGTLGITLYKMFPLNRPQVFFLTTQPRSTLEVTLTEMVPSTPESLKKYTESFIREYIRARNEVTPNSRVMLRKWSNDADGVVRAWSADDVYGQFTRTNLWRAITSSTPDFEFSCSVEFKSDGTGAVTPRAQDTYAVKFRYFCADKNGRQTTPKDYTIIVKLELGAPTTIRWADRLNNPLGIRVAGYEIESGNGDPLDTGYLGDATE